MARIFDVVEYPSEMMDEIVHRFPETGVADLRFGSQVIVRESQRAVFFRDGHALDVLGPGRHTISTANVPLLTDLLGKAFGDRTPFTAEIYFVSMREFADRKWGTPQPILVRNPKMGLGVALLQGFGSYSFQVRDPQQFVTQIVGSQGMYRTSDIENRLRSMLLSKLQDLLGETAATNDVAQLIGLTEEIGAGVRAKGQDDFAAIGLTLKSFYIANLKPSEKSAEELRADGCARHGHLYPTAGSRRDARCCSKSERRRWIDGWNWRRVGHWKRADQLAAGRRTSRAAEQPAAALRRRLWVSQM